MPQGPQDTGLRHVCPPCGLHAQAPRPVASTSAHRPTHAAHLSCVPRVPRPPAASPPRRCRSGRFLASPPDRAATAPLVPAAPPTRPLAYPAVDLSLHQCSVPCPVTSPDRAFSFDAWLQRLMNAPGFRTSSAGPAHRARAARVRRGTGLRRKRSHRGRAGGPAIAVQITHHFDVTSRSGDIRDRDGLAGRCARNVFARWWRRRTKEIKSCEPPRLAARAPTGSMG